MNPIPLHLPVRPDQAAEVASLIFEHAERKPLTEELRNRLGARAGALNLAALAVHFGSLARDPIHPSVYYLAVDGNAGQPLLLHIALASAPSSGLFPEALLICRTRRMNGPEFVVNAIPFAPGDRAHIDRFVTQVDGAFLPRPQGSRASITIRTEPVRAFDFFRTTYKRRGRNLAAIAGDFHECVWAAIRAGWRQEYSVVAEVSLERTCEVARDTLAYTRFSVDAGKAGLAAAAQEHEEIRQARVLLKTASEFEFEVELGDVNAAELALSFERLKALGHAPQFVGVGPGECEALAEVARQSRFALSFRYSGESEAVIESVAKATGGRLNYYVNTPAEAEMVAEYF
jgi:hypothetical protein